MEYAYKRDIALFAHNGSNLNYLTEEMIEAVVKYKFRAITCSIDGVNQKSYAIYREKGDFDKAIANIKRIRKKQARYQSPYPQLIWQFIAFGHNEADILQAKSLAEELGMEFYVKLNWGDFYGLGEFSPIKNRDWVRNAGGMFVADRDEYKQKYGHEYEIRNCCLKMWRSPQINFDGRVLGCSINYWADYGNAFNEGLLKTLNSPPMHFARNVLMGREAVKEGIPCASCKYFRIMQENSEWIKHSEIKRYYVPSKWGLLLKNRINRYALGRDMLKAMRAVKYDFLRKSTRFTQKISSSFKQPSPSGSEIFPLQLPLAPKQDRPHSYYPIFNRVTKGLDVFTCHVSVLTHGERPHPPHTHEEEEMLLVLDGKIDIVFRESAYHHRERSIRMQKGQFVYYPCSFAHTLESVGTTPANYLMLKWRGAYKKTSSVLPFNHYDAVRAYEKCHGKDGFSSRLIVQEKTNYLKKFHCHVSTLSPRAGYEPHSDWHNVVIIVMEGEVETLQKRVQPHGVIFYAAGEAHGMRNPGDVEAKYIVFEFHS